MDFEQITNIGIQIGELQQKADFTLWAAVVACVGSIIGVIIAGWTARRLKEIEKKQQTQWAYLGKQSTLIDLAIDVCAKMLFNKLLLAYKVDESTAAINLFVLRKEALVLESQLVVYGNVELVDAVHDYVDLILNTPTDKFLGEWAKIYNKGREHLLVFRKVLGEGVSQEYKDFEKKLKNVSQFQPPSAEQVKGANASGLGGTAH